jgi:pimeloyl-ACP methyl ester carboxylesterase
VEVAVDVWPGDSDKVPFLLVHGLASNARLWDGVASALVGRGHPVAAVDQRGHGRSGKPDAGYDFATVVADLLAVIKALDWDRPVVVGQSWGGNVVVELGIAHPDAVRAIATVDGGVRDMRARIPQWEDCARLLAPPVLEGMPFVEIDAAVRKRHPDWPEAGIEGTLANFEVRDDGTVAPWLTRDRHMQILRHLWELPVTERLPLLHVPALFILAQGDDVHAPPDVAVPAPGSDVRWLVGDHDLHAQHPDEVAGLLAEFVA